MLTYNLRLVKHNELKILAFYVTRIALPCPLAYAYTLRKVVLTIMNSMKR